ncbi:MAG: hypothetical protein A3A86_01780 [Elusimicrobia bacterium RIFCSPLOWO2_01_FULL_60_11]|nr:MAG: hypothetical protein A3A86_01780 [Elusimicrobia bacterium RIFCSPLOWO2_01_FULL_60_11]
MLSPDDWADVLWEGLKKPRRSARLFLSEYEIKRMITPDKILRVPGNAILSPLALDWLLLKGVQVVREA